MTALFVLNCIICLLSVKADPILVLYNARIYTLDQDIEWADALAIDREQGILLEVGRFESVNATVPDSANVTYIDIEEKLVITGFHDAHLHVVEAGINSNLCLLDEDASLDDLDFYFYPDPEFCPTGGPFGDQGWIAGAGLDIIVLMEELEKKLTIRADTPSL
eukprot:scaffold84_cov163-Amphora_coffeaeformis.AAC.5